MRCSVGTVNYHNFTVAVDDPSKLIDPIVGPPKPFPSTREQEDAYNMADSTIASSGVGELMTKITRECRVNAIRVHGKASSTASALSFTQLQQ